MANKLTGPGLFRLFLALLVFFNHASRFQIGIGAVFVFFCLSGYWICRMYRGRYAGTRQPYLTYLVSRAWRLLPTFLLLTVIALLFLWVHGNLADYWAKSNHLHFVLSNLFILGYQSLPLKPLVPAWSLDIEMQFYLIAPLLVAFLTWRKVPPALLLFAAFIVSPLSMIWLGPACLGSYIFFFLSGMVVASSNWKPSPRVAALSFGGVALLIVICMASPYRGVLLAGRHPGPLAVYSIWANYVLALCMIPYAMFTTEQKGFRLDGMFADLSYIVYLLHWTVVQWMSDHLGPHRFLYAATGTVFLMVASVIIWKYYDHPINKLRSAWVSHRKKSVVEVLA